MTSRRDFLKGSMIIAAGVTTTSLLPGEAAAAAFPSNVVYTKDDPGQWKNKVGSHLPVVTVDGTTVTIETKHGMSAQHYIVRHTLIGAHGEVLGARNFSSTSPKAFSTFENVGRHKTLYATSFCNLHDLWIAEVHLS